MLTMFVNENIIRLDVSVQHHLYMHLLDATQQLFEDSLYLSETELQLAC